MAVTRKKNRSHAETEIPNGEKGVTNANIAIALTAISLEIITFVIGWWLYHANAESLAFEWAEAKKQRDLIITECRKGADNIEGLKIWSDRIADKPPPNLLVAPNCVIVQEKKEGEK